MSRHPKLFQRAFAGGEVSSRMYPRVDDNRLQLGASKMRNVVAHPQGMASKRPGTQFVAYEKEEAVGLGASMNLLPFVASVGDTFEIEVGRATIDSHEIGYFRFHSNGSTLLFDKPDEYVAPLNTATVAANEYDFGAPHGFRTGDEIVVTFSPALAGTVTVLTRNITLANPATDYFKEGYSTCTFHATTMPEYFTDWATLATKPLVKDKVYYVSSLTAGDLRITETPGGPDLWFSTAGSGLTVAGTGWRLASRDHAPLEPQTIMYAIEGSTANKLKLAITYNDALAGTNVTLPTRVATTLKFHRAYKSGDIVYSTASASSWRCIRKPWTMSPFHEGFCYTNDHTDHSPGGGYGYWVRLPDKYFSSTTVDTGLDTFNFVANHGLVEGDPVIIYCSGAPAASLTNGTVMFVRKPAAKSFEVSLTKFGPKVDLTSSGSSITLFAKSYYEVHHFYSSTAISELSTAQSYDVMSLATREAPFSELRRVSSTRWDYSSVPFTSALLAPSGVTVSADYGYAYVADITATAAPVEFSFSVKHTLNDGSIVYVTEGFEPYGIDPGYYMVDEATTPSTQQVKLDTLLGAPKAATATSGMTQPGYLIPVSTIGEAENYYVVTTVDSDGIESSPSAEALCRNPLNSNGGKNTVEWSPVYGAKRYRVYRKSSGIYAWIGDSDATSFVDDNIKPDGGVTPPIVDSDLRKIGSVSFDTTADVVTWAGHSLDEGSPIRFFSNGTLPTGITEGVTYYARNVDGDTMQLSASSSSADIIDMTGSPSGEHGAEAGVFPATVSYYEGRRCLGGGFTRPQDVWLTASGTESDMTYSLPITDGDRIHFRYAMREGAGLRHFVPLSHLLMLTESSEVRVTPLNDDSLTPTSIAARPQTYVGSNRAQPVITSGNVVFCEARGGRVRELGYSQQQGGYAVSDLSIRAQHLFDGYEVSRIAYAKAPVPVIWSVSSSGHVLGCTYIPEEGVVAWHQHDTYRGATRDEVEVLTVVPEDDEDRLYWVVNRGGVRYIERMARHRFVSVEQSVHLDCAVVYDGPATTTLYTPLHLSGVPVNYYADGVAGTATVSMTGVLTLPTAASYVVYGFPITSQLQTVPIYLQIDQALANGRTKNVNTIWVRCENSGRFQVGVSGGRMDWSPQPAAGTLLSELVRVPVPGSWTDDGMLMIEHSAPTPLAITSYTIEVAAGG